MCRGGELKNAPSNKPLQASAAASFTSTPIAAPRRLNAALGACAVNRQARMNLYMLDERKLLTRYWINVDGLMDYGVTAFSVEDALCILADEGVDRELIKEIIENIDVRLLDQRHIIPNMGPPSFRGIWYACLNIGWRYPRRSMNASWSKDRTPEKLFVCQMRVEPRRKIGS